MIKRSPIRQRTARSKRARKRTRAKAASSSQALALPKSQPRNREAERDAESLQRKAVRLATVKAWGSTCAARCGFADWQRLQIHEEPPRAHGGDPLDELDCMPLCPACHAKRTGELGKGKTLDILPVSPMADRCRGPVRFTRIFSGRPIMSWFTVPWSQSRFSSISEALTAPTSWIGNGGTLEIPLSPADRAALGEGGSFIIRRKD